MRSGRIGSSSLMSMFSGTSLLLGIPHVFPSNALARVAGGATENRHRSGVGDPLGVVFALAGANRSEELLVFEIIHALRCARLAPVPGILSRD